MATTIAPHEKLNALLEQAGYGRVTFFTVKDGILTETVISKKLEYIFFPVAKVVRDVTESFDEYLYQTSSDVGTLADEYDYYEEDFVDAGKTEYFAIEQSEISIDELARRLFELSKQYPFSQYVAGDEIISNDNLKPQIV